MEAIDNAIKLLAEKVSGEIKSDDALKFTQSALNLAHVNAVLSNIVK